MLAISSSHGERVFWPFSGRQYRTYITPVTSQWRYVPANNDRLPSDLLKQMYMYISPRVSCTPAEMIRSPLEKGDAWPGHTMELVAVQYPIPVPAAK